jgi:hypothetical protein
MKELNSVWRQAQVREQRRRYGYAIVPVVKALPKVAPTERPAASLVDILGFKPSR